MLAVVIAACGVEDAGDTAETLPGTDAAAQVAPGTPSEPSFSRYHALVDQYEAFDWETASAPDGCRHTVSKQLEGRWASARAEVQSGGFSATKTLKQVNQFEIFVVSGPSDSALSRDVLDTDIEGEFVAAYEGGNETGRGTLHGRWRWGSDAVGTYFSVLNVGSHNDPPPADQPADQTQRAEGVMLGAVTSYKARNALIEGAITFDFEASASAAQFKGVFEGVMITECS